MCSEYIILLKDNSLLSNSQWSPESSSCSWKGLSHPQNLHITLFPLNTHSLTATTCPGPADQQTSYYWTMADQSPHQPSTTRSSLISSSLILMWLCSLLVLILASYLLKVFHWILWDLRSVISKSAYSLLPVETSLSPFCTSWDLTAHILIPLKPFQEVAFTLLDPSYQGA